jgi:hypothetical protein
MGISGWTLVQNQPISQHLLSTWLSPKPERPALYYICSFWTAGVYLDKIFPCRWRIGPAANTVTIKIRKSGVQDGGEFSGSVSIAHAVSKC